VVGSWTVDNSAGFDGDQRVISGGAATDAATWTFADLTPGYQYRVSATWRPASARASNASYAVIDNVNYEIDDVLGTVTVNQRLAPADFTDGGASWQDLGDLFLVRGDGLTVRLSGAGNGQVVADAVRIERVGAWVPPVGVPVPSFGIEQSHWIYADPQYTYDYGSGSQPYKIGPNGPYTHYVDQGAGGATDSGNSFGTPAKPRMTLPSTLTPGSVVEVHGTYNSSWSTVAHGSADRPVFLRGPSVSEKVTVNGSVSIRGEYAVWENIYQPGMRSVSASNYSSTVPHHVAVRNVEQVGTTANSSGMAMSVYGDDGYDVHDVVLYDNYVHTQGNSENKPETDRHGMAVTRHTYNVWVVDNHVHHCQGDSIQFNGWENETTRNIYLGRNVFHDDGENAVDIKEASHIVVSENIMYGYADASYSVMNAHCDDGAAAGPDNVWVLNNEIFHGFDGIVSMGIKDDFFAVGNLVYDMKDGGIKSWRPGTRHIFGNTVYDVKRGIVHADGAEVHVTDNIISNIRSGGRHVDIESVSSASTMHNNLIYQNGSSPTIVWGSTYSSVSALNSGSSRAVGNIGADPKFVDAGAADFHLAANSPAIDAGESLDSLADRFYSAFGVEIAMDKDGTSRPRGTATDIGAYEFPQGDEQQQNSPPVASNATASGEQDQPVTGTVHAYDANGDALTYRLDGQATDGSAQMTPSGGFTYTPRAGWSGTDSFTYLANDGLDDSNAATVSVTISPAGTDGQLAVAAVVASSYEDPNVPANTIDGATDNRWSAEGDGEWIRFDLGAPHEVTRVLVAWHNGDSRVETFDIEASTDGAAWTNVFSGDSSGTTADFETYGGLDATARYVRLTCHGSTAGMWNSISEVQVYGGDAGDLVIAADDSADTNQAEAVTIDVLANDSGPNGNELSVSELTQPGHGSASINADDTVTYTPAPDWYGTDSFTYTVTDGETSADASVFVDVTAAVHVLPGDLNHDGLVSQADLDLVLGNWARQVPPGSSLDPSGDGLVGQADLDLVLRNWGLQVTP
jgi:hypothetical protein